MNVKLYNDGCLNVLKDDDGYFDIGVNRIKEHIESNNMNVELNLK